MSVATVVVKENDGEVCRGTEAARPKRDGAKGVYEEASDWI